MNIDKFLRKIADSQKLAPKDRLTEIVNLYDETELSEEELMNVSAAVKPKFDAYLKLMEDRD